MEIIFEPAAEEDLNYWIKSGNKKILKGITLLLESVSETPYEGIGKPKQLKHELSGVCVVKEN